VSGAFADMPLLLKGITSFFLVFGLGSLLLPLAPGIEQHVAGSTLARADFFAAGYGRLAVGMGVWLTASAFGLLRRSVWGCWGVVLACALFVPAEHTLATAPRLGLQSTLAVAWAAAAWAYLFHTRGAAAFFAGGAAP